MKQNYEVLKHSSFDALNSIEQEFIVKWFLYYMSQNTRRMLLLDHPVIYNKLCGTEIVYVEKNDHNPQLNDAINALGD